MNDPLHRAALALAPWFWETVARTTDGGWESRVTGHAAVIRDALLEQGWKVRELDHDEAYRKTKSRWDKFWNRYIGNEDRIRLLRRLPLLFRGSEEPFGLRRSAWIWTVHSRHDIWRQIARESAQPATRETPPRPA